MHQPAPTKVRPATAWSLASRLLWPVVLLVLLAGLVLTLWLRFSIETHFAEMDAADLQSYAWQQLQHPADSQQHAEPQQQHDNTHHPRFAWRVSTIQQSMDNRVDGHRSDGHRSDGHRGDGHHSKGNSGQDWPALLQPLQQQAAVSQITPAGLTDWTFQGVAYRGARWQSPDGVEVAVAMSLTVHQQYLSQLYLQLALSVAAAGLLVLCTGWFSIRLGLRPLQQLSRTIAAVAPEQLDQRLDPAQLPAELQQLAISFNQMVSRLQQSFARLNEFSADIAHELRTPLSNLITQTEVSLGQARTTEQYRELLYSNLEELNRLARMVSDMLWLAKTDHGLVQLQRQPVQLQPLCQGLLEYFQILADERQLSMQLTGPDLTVPADKAMLQRALSNLLSNAVRHARAGTVVECQLVHQPGQPELCGIRVVNQGATIAPQLQQRLFERFFRADAARQRDGQEGAGLGLALVQSIAQLHQGHVRVQSEQGTTCFTLWLPCQSSLDDNAGQAMPAPLR